MWRALVAASDSRFLRNNYRSRMARGGEHPAQEKEVARLNGRHVRTKRRWRIRQMNAELGETVLGGRRVVGHDEGSFIADASHEYPANSAQRLRIGHRRFSQGKRAAPIRPGLLASSGPVPRRARVPAPA